MLFRSVNPLPIPIFTAPSVCLNMPTVFTDQSTTATGNITSWNWNFGDGNNSAQQSPSHTYNAPGNYTVTLILTNSFGCKDTLQQNVLVKPLPVVNFSAPPVCVGTPTCFNDLSTIASGTITGWSWNFADPSSGNNISNAQNPCHTFTAAGNYNVILTATSDSGCQSSTVISVLVNQIGRASCRERV